MQCCAWVWLFCGGGGLIFCRIETTTMTILIFWREASFLVKGYGPALG